MTRGPVLGHVNWPLHSITLHHTFMKFVGVLTEKTLDSLDTRQKATEYQWLALSIPLAYFT